MRLNEKRVSHFHALAWHLSATGHGITVPGSLADALEALRQDLQDEQLRGRPGAPFNVSSKST